MGRDYTLGIRLSPEERAELERAARLDDRDLVDWARRALLRIAKQQIGRRKKAKGEKRWSKSGTETGER
jgi:uncharacterized protein (DUF1778 family)